MRLFLPGFALAAACVAALPLEAGEANEQRALAPSSPWQADFGDESCALKRTFGEGPEQIMLEIRKYGPSRSSQLTILGKSLAPTGEVFVYRLPGEVESSSATTQVIRAFEGGFKGITTTVRSGNRRDTQPPAELANTLAILGGFSEPVVLETGAMGEAIKVLNHCTKNLLRVWGVIETVDSDRPTSATMTNRDRVRAEMREKYNGQSRLRREEGRMHLRIMVDQSGNAISCHNQASTELTEFTEKACETIMRLAKFEPGKDKQGKATASYSLFTSTFGQL